jgi:hypothetical protein
MLNSGDLNFSFSGLKTAVRYLLPKIVIPSEVEGSRKQSFRELRRGPSTSLRSARDDRPFLIWHSRPEILKIRSDENRAGWHGGDFD